MVATRELRGLTKSQFARAAGISAAYVTQLESGVRTRPTPSTLRSIGEVLNIDPRALYCEPQVDRLLDELVEKINGDGEALEVAIVRLNRVKALGK